MNQSRGRVAMANISASELQLLKWVGPRGRRDVVYQATLDKPDHEFDNRPYVFIPIRSLLEALEQIRIKDGQRVDVAANLQVSQLRLTVKVEFKLWKGKPAGEVSLDCYDLAWGFGSLLHQPKAIGLLTAWGVPFFTGSAS